MLKLLIVKTSSLGDVIHNLPVLADARAHFPDAQIDWVVEESFADIPRMHPYVNQVFTVAFRRWRKQLLSATTWAEINQFKKIIKKNQYDVVIDTQGLLKSALITHYAHGLKHGYDKNSIREPLASRFYDVIHAISYKQHAVTRNRTLVAQSLDYALPLDYDLHTGAPDYGIITSKSALSLPNKFIIALHGTSRDSKLWPTQHWVELGLALNKQGLSLVLPWASDAEQARAQIIHQQVANSIVLPKLNISELAGVIAQAQVAIGVDTGLSHLAAALNIPTIAIYTDTNPVLTGVMAGAKAKTINLGGISQTPSVDLVLQALKQVL